MLHVAHIRHLQEASKFADALVVGVTKDAFVGKGRGRPVIPEAERLEMIKSLKCVAGAALCDDSLEALKWWRPSVFVKGADYIEKGLLDDEVEYCKANNIEIRHTKPNPQTTSAIIERIKCLRS